MQNIKKWSNGEMERVNECMGAWLHECMEFWSGGVMEEKLFLIHS